MDALGEHFMDATGFDLRLVPTSLAIDAGSSLLAPEWDRDGIFRPQGSAVDVGAYEYYEGTPVEPDPKGPAGGCSCHLGDHGGHGGSAAALGGLRHNVVLLMGFFLGLVVTRRGLRGRRVTPPPEAPRR